MEQGKLPIEQINEIAHMLPAIVLEDVNKRMTDWKAGGGSDNDPYMHQQLRFALRFVNKEEGMNHGI